MALDILVPLHSIRLVPDRHHNNLARNRMQHRWEWKHQALSTSEVARTEDSGTGETERKHSIATQTSLACPESHQMPRCIVTKRHLDGRHRRRHNIQSIFLPADISLISLRENLSPRGA